MLKSGTYPDVPFADYLAMDAVNSSTLRLFARSAAHARQELTHPSPPTAAQDIGQAIHAAILEPDRYGKEYVTAPKVDRRTREGKATWAAFEVRHAGATILRAEDAEVCAGMSAAAWTHPVVAQILGGDGMNEVVVLGRDPDHECDCKIRIDRLTTYDGWTVVVDVKSTDDARAFAFARSAAKYQYHAQAAFYLDVCDTVHAAKRRHLTIAIEKKPPHCCAVFELAATSLEQGRQDYKRWMAELLECKKSGVWPGYPEAVQDLELPAWALSPEDWEV